MKYDKRYPWGRNREAAEQILTFMGSLVRFYTGTPYRQMWQSMEQMTERYGTVTVAEMVVHHKIEAEMALMRYGRSRRCGNISSM